MESERKNSEEKREWKSKRIKVKGKGVKDLGEEVRVGINYIM